MHRIFGRAKPAEAAAPPPSMDDHLKRLNDKVPELDAKIAACDKELGEIKAQLGRLRPAQQGPLKQKALNVLKRKKLYEGQRGQMQTRAFNLEQTQFAIDSVKEAQDHVQMLKHSAATLQSAQASVDIDELAELQDDMMDMLADSNEINEVLGRSYDTYSGVDEADLDAELAALGDDLTLGDASTSAIGAGAAAAADAAPVAAPSWATASSSSLPVAVVVTPGGGPSAYPAVPTSSSFVPTAAVGQGGGGRVAAAGAANV